MLTLHLMISNRWLDWPLVSLSFSNQIWNKIISRKKIDLLFDLSFRLRSYFICMKQFHPLERLWSNCRYTDALTLQMSVPMINRVNIIAIVKVVPSMEHKMKILNGFTSHSVKLLLTLTFCTKLNWSIENACSFAKEDKNRYVQTRVCYASTSDCIWTLCVRYKRFVQVDSFSKRGEIK